MEKIFLVLMLFALILSSCAKQTTLSNYNDEEFKAGQVWQYNSRPGEEQSTFTVLKVEKDTKLGIIVHIAINGVNMKSGSGEVKHEIGHLPLSKESIEKSAKSIVRTESKLPDYQEGYSQWRNAFDQGKAGIWTVSISEAVETVEQAQP